VTVGAPDAEHLRHHFVREQQAVPAGAIVRVQQPPAAALFRRVEADARRRLQREREEQLRVAAGRARQAGQPGQRAPEIADGDPPRVAGPIKTATSTGSRRPPQSAGTPISPSRPTAATSSDSHAGVRLASENTPETGT
jgi:hypothetical protein